MIRLNCFFQATDGENGRHGAEGQRGVDPGKSSRTDQRPPEVPENRFRCHEESGKQGQNKEPEQRREQKRAESRQTVGAERKSTGGLNGISPADLFPGNQGFRARRQKDPAEDHHACGQQLRHAEGEASVPGRAQDRREIEGGVVTARGLHKEEDQRREKQEINPVREDPGVREGRILEFASDFIGKRNIDFNYIPLIDGEDGVFRQSFERVLGFGERLGKKKPVFVGRSDHIRQRGGNLNRVLSEYLPGIRCGQSRIKGAERREVQ